MDENPLFSNNLKNNNNNNNKRAAKAAGVIVGTSRLTGSLNDTMLIGFGSIAMASTVSEPLNHF